MKHKQGKEAEGESNRFDWNSNLRGLLDEFLDVVLAEAAMASVVDLSDEGDGLRLAHRHHPNLVRRNTGPLRRLLHPRQHRPQGQRRRAFGR